MSSLELHHDDWTMKRIGKALDAIRHAEYAGLETELDLISFAEDVLEHFGNAEMASFFKDTWPAFQRGDIDLSRVRTDLIRAGWPKPTIYREHEAIHVLANALDQALTKPRKPYSCAFQCGVEWSIEEYGDGSVADRHYDEEHQT